MTTSNATPRAQEGRPQACTLCRCLPTTTAFGFPVCAYHETHGEDDPPCPTCAVPAAPAEDARGYVSTTTEHVTSVLEDDDAPGMYWAHCSRCGKLQGFGWTHERSLAVAWAAEHASGPSAPAEEPVGWLYGSARGMYVVCRGCEPAQARNATPVYPINLRPYRQPCAVCGAELIQPHVSTILFDGQPPAWEDLLTRLRAAVLRDNVAVPGHTRGARDPLSIREAGPVPAESSERRYGLAFADVVYDGHHVATYGLSAGGDWVLWSN